MTAPNFWDNTHPLSADNERLYNELVPASGNCETLQGELLRASSKIGYDWYNNGWGCNNWSGAVVFLNLAHGKLAGNRTPGEKEEFNKAMNFVHSYSHGESTSCLDDDKADVAVTTIAAFITQCILDNPTPVVNKVDMWSLSEPDARRDEDEDENYDEWDDED